MILILGLLIFHWTEELQIIQDLLAQTEKHLALEETLLPKKTNK
jgi:hypothetical protein